MLAPAANPPLPRLNASAPIHGAPPPARRSSRSAAPPDPSTDPAPVLQELDGSDARALTQGAPWRVDLVLTLIERHRQKLGGLRIRNAAPTPRQLARSLWHIAKRRGHRLAYKISDPQGLHLDVAIVGSAPTRQARRSRERTNRAGLPID